MNHTVTISLTDWVDFAFILPLHERVDSVFLKADKEPFAKRGEKQKMGLDGGEFTFEYVFELLLDSLVGLFWTAVEQTEVENSEIEKSLVSRCI